MRALDYVKGRRDLENGDVTTFLSFLFETNDPLFFPFSFKLRRKESIVVVMGI